MWLTKEKTSLSGGVFSLVVSPSEMKRTQVRILSQSIDLTEYS